MYNVLDRTKEVELTVFRNELFTLQLDFEYNQGDITTLYLLAFPTEIGTLRTLRDLTGKHLPLLKSIRDNSYQAIENKFGLPKSQVKALFHYYPTYFHLHVHFVHVEVQANVSAFCGKGVLLEDVIEHLEMDGDYFKKKTMVVHVGEQHPMFKIF